MSQSTLARPHPVLVDHLTWKLGERRWVDLLLVVGGAALIALSTLVRIPLGFTPVPVSGQTFAVLLLGAALGPRRGAAAAATYLVVGAAGLPLFSGGGAGLGYLLGPTGGYLVGFVAAAAVVGALAQRRLDRHVLPAALAMLVGNVVIYAFGVTWLAVSSGSGVARAIELGVVPFLAGDALKIAVAALVLPGAWAIVEALAPGREGR